MRSDRSHPLTLSTQHADLPPASNRRPARNAHNRVRIGALEREAAHATHTSRFQEGALSGDGYGAATRATSEQHARNVGAGARQVKQRGAKALPQLQRKLNQAKCAGRGLRVTSRSFGCG